MKETYEEYQQRMAKIRQDSGEAWNKAKDDADYLRRMEAAQREREEAEKKKQK